MKKFNRIFLILGLILILAVITCSLVANATGPVKIETIEMAEFPNSPTFIDSYGQSFVLVYSKTTGKIYRRYTAE